MYSENLKLWLQYDNVQWRSSGHLPDAVQQVFLLKQVDHRILQS